MNIHRVGADALTRHSRHIRIAHLFATGDAEEGIAAFSTKRTPQFHGH